MPSRRRTTLVLARAVRTGIEPPDSAERCWLPQALIGWRHL